jgi:excisionase family DNA binding protein
MATPTSPPSTPSQSDWMTLGQASKQLGVTAATIRKWSDQGRLPVFYTPGGHRRFRARDLEAFVSFSTPATARHHRLVLLVSKDEMELGDYLRANLELAGCEVRSAGSGDRALATTGDRAPDLVLLDLAISDSEGWPLLRRLEERVGLLPVLAFDSRHTVDADTLVVHATRVSLS